MTRLLLVIAMLVAASSAQTSLSQSDKQLLLDLHNQERSIVSPTASDMKIMVWNEELARVAQQYAEGCVFEHNQARSQQAPSFNYVGENIAAGSGGTTYQGLFDGWANEKNDYSFSSNTCQAVCGHYTQVVWADSEQVGCGAYRCANLQNAAFNNAIFLVCNYGPGGNIVGNRPYTSGSSCGECDSGYQYCMNNLCSQQQSAGSDQPPSSNTTGATTPNGAMGSMMTSATTLLLLLGLVALSLVMA